jgi:hypothetical protein
MVPIKPIGPSVDTALFEQLVNEAQERDAEDERRLFTQCVALGPRFARKGISIPGHDSTRD